MKTTLKAIGGILAMGVGAVGVALSIFLILQIRQTASRLERELPQSLRHVEQIAQSVRLQGEATTQMLQTTRERVAFLGQSIEDLSSRLGDRDTAGTLLMAIDQDIDIQLDNAKQFVLSMQISMRNLGSTLLLFDSMSIFGGQGFPRFTQPEPSKEETPLRTVAVGLTQSADLLDQVTLAISRLQTGESITPLQLSRIQSTLQQVDSELKNIETEIGKFSLEVAETEAKITNMKRASPGWIRFFSDIISLFLFCFGFAQLMLSVYGLHLTNAARKTWALANKDIPPTS